MNPEERQNLSNLLLSTDDKNIRLGLEFLLHNHQYVTDFTKELFLIYRLHDLSEIKEIITTNFIKNKALAFSEEWELGFEFFNKGVYYYVYDDKVKKLIKDHEFIRSEFQALIEQNANYSLEYYYGAAKLKRFDKLKDITEVYYKIALKANPDHSYALFDLAYMLEEDRTTESLKYYERYISLNPNNSNAMNNMGWLYQLQGNKEKAYKYYHKANKAKASYFYKRNLAALCVRMDEQKYKEEGEALFAELIEEHGNETMVWNSWASYLWNVKGDYKEAENAYIKGLKIQPDEPFLLGNLGELYIDILDEVDKGIELYEKSLKVENQTYRLTTMVTALVNKKEDWKQAKKYYKLLVDKFEPKPIKKHRDLRANQWEDFVLAEKKLKEKIEA